MRTSYISPISMGPHKMSRKIEGAKANLASMHRSRGDLTTVERTERASPRLMRSSMVRHTTFTASERDLAGPVNTRSGPTIRVLMAAVHFFTLNAVGSAGIYRVLSDRNNHVLTGNEVRCLPVPFGTSARYPGTLSKPSITCLFVARLIDC